MPIKLKKNQYKDNFTMFYYKNNGNFTVFGISGSGIRQCQS